MRGGYRPGAGRKKGKGPPKPPKGKSQAAIDREQIRALLATGIKAKAKIYQDFLIRIGNKGPDGQSLNLPPLTMPEKQLMTKLGAELAAEVKEDVQVEGHNPEDAKSKDYLERLLADPNIDQETKIRIANILLPYQYPRLSDGIGKKDEKQDRAKTAGQGKFKASAPPLKLVRKT